MELRLLQSENERRVFEGRMDEARAKRGIGFKESPRSRLGRVHLAFGELYALFEEEGEPAERMMSGFVMHDLGTFPQSHPKPDLTQYPARTVFECGELWSFSKGAGILARRGATIVAALREAHAILVYPAVKPWDNTISFTENGFARACGPVVFPYVRTFDDRDIWVQPMTLEGKALRHLVRKVLALGFETRDNHSIVRFDNPFPLKPSLERPAIPADSLPVVRGEKVDAGEVNGTAQM